MITFALALLGLLTMTVVLIRTVLADGYGANPPPRSHVGGPDIRARR